MNDAEDATDANAGGVPSGSSSKQQLLATYKRLEARLSGELSGAERTRDVVAIWTHVRSLCRHAAPASHCHLAEWARRHTHGLLLSDDWQKDKNAYLRDHLDSTFAKFEEDADPNEADMEWEQTLLDNVRHLRQLAVDPWAPPVLRALLDPCAEQPTDDEVVGWLRRERGGALLMRLERLAASKKCDDLALQLITTIMDRLRASGEQKDGLSARLQREAGFTPEALNRLTDMELTLLHSAGKTDECIKLMKSASLTSGKGIVERLSARTVVPPPPSCRRLWKNVAGMATLAAQVMVTRYMVMAKMSEDDRRALFVCARELSRMVPANSLQQTLCSLAALASSSVNLHCLALACRASPTASRRPLACDLYVRALTAGMNELERAKGADEGGAEACRLERSLSAWLLQLAELLVANPRVFRECILTAFSVHPASYLYERVVACPHVEDDAAEKETTPSSDAASSEFGSWASDSRPSCSTSFVKNSTTLAMSASADAGASAVSSAVLEGEGLDLSPELCQDLAVLLSGPRIKTLHWQMNRERLLENCRTYMERRAGGTIALTAPIRFAHLDPSVLEHLPYADNDDEEDRDEYYGIEKGYEHLLDLEDESLSESKSLESSLHKAVRELMLTDGESPLGSDDSDYSYGKQKHRKKKQIMHTYHELDPLSFNHDDKPLPELSKKKEKKSKSKERPHSKDRSVSQDGHRRKDRDYSKHKCHSKDRGHKKNRLKNKDRSYSSDRYTKEKKEKKHKKDKHKFTDERNNKNTSFSKLVGLQVHTVDFQNEKKETVTINNSYENSNCQTSPVNAESQSRAKITVTDHTKQVPKHLSEKEFTAMTGINRIEPSDLKLNVNKPKSNFSKSSLSFHDTFAKAIKEAEINNQSIFDPLSLKSSKKLPVNTKHNQYTMRAVKFELQNKKDVPLVPTDNVDINILSSKPVHIPSKLSPRINEMKEVKSKPSTSELLHQKILPLNSDEKLHTTQKTPNSNTEKDSKNLKNSPLESGFAKTKQQIPKAITSNPSLVIKELEDQIAYIQKKMLEQEKNNAKVSALLNFRKHKSLNSPAASSSLNTQRTASPLDQHTVDSIKLSDSRVQSQEVQINPAANEQTVLQQQNILIMEPKTAQDISEIHTSIINKKILPDMVQTLSGISNNLHKVKIDGIPLSIPVQKGYTPNSPKTNPIVANPNEPGSYISLLPQVAIQKSTTIPKSNSADIETSNISSPNSIQDFLKELRTTNNAGAVKSPTKIVQQLDAQHSNILKKGINLLSVNRMASINKLKQVMPLNTSNLGTIKPNSKVCENTLNTFARKNYLHKSKQNELKLKSKENTKKEPVESKTLQSAILQSHGHGPSIMARKPGTLCGAKVKSIVSANPLLSSILKNKEANTDILNHNINANAVKSPEQPSNSGDQPLNLSPKKTLLSDHDQKDIANILMQQVRLTEHTLHKNTKSAILNDTKPSIMKDLCQQYQHSIKTKPEMLSNKHNLPSKQNIHPKQRELAASPKAYATKQEKLLEKSDVMHTKQIQAHPSVKNIPKKQNVQTKELKTPPPFVQNIQENKMYALKQKNNALHPNVQGPSLQTKPNQFSPKHTPVNKSSKVKQQNLLTVLPKILGKLSTNSCVKPPKENKNLKINQNMIPSHQLVLHKQKFLPKLKSNLSKVEKPNKHIKMLKQTAVHMSPTLTKKVYQYIGPTTKKGLCKSKSSWQSVFDELRSYQTVRHTDEIPSSVYLAQLKQESLLKKETEKTITIEKNKYVTSDQETPSTTTDTDCIDYPFLDSEIDKDLLKEIEELMSSDEEEKKNDKLRPSSSSQNFLNPSYAADGNTSSDSNTVGLLTPNRDDKLEGKESKKNYEGMVHINDIYNAIIDKRNSQLMESNLKKKSNTTSPVSDTMTSGPKSGISESTTQHNTNLIGSKILGFTQRKSAAPKPTSSVSHNKKPSKIQILSNEVIHFPIMKTNTTEANMHDIVMKESVVFKDKQFKNQQYLTKPHVPEILKNVEVMSETRKVLSDSKLETKIKSLSQINISKVTRKSGIFASELQSGEIKNNSMVLDPMEQLNREIKEKISIKSSTPLSTKIEPIQKEPSIENRGEISNKPMLTTVTTDHQITITTTPDDKNDDSSTTRTQAKRWNILNRISVSRINYPPIPLKYEPLNVQPEPKIESNVLTTRLRSSSNWESLKQESPVGVVKKTKNVKNALEKLVNVSENAHHIKTNVKTDKKLRLRKSVKISSPKKKKFNKKHSMNNTTPDNISKSIGIGQTEQPSNENCKDDKVLKESVCSNATDSTQIRNDNNEYFDIEEEIISSTIMSTGTEINEIIIKKNQTKLNEVPKKSPETRTNEVSTVATASNKNFFNVAECVTISGKSDFPIIDFEDAIHGTEISVASKAIIYNEDTNILEPGQCDLKVERDNLNKTEIPLIEFKNNTDSTFVKPEQCTSIIRIRKCSNLADLSFDDPDEVINNDKQHEKGNDLISESFEKSCLDNTNKETGILKREIIEKDFEKTDQNYKYMQPILNTTERSADAVTAIEKFADGKTIKTSVEPINQINPKVANLSLNRVLGSDTSKLFECTAEENGFERERKDGNSDNLPLEMEVTEEPPVVKRQMTIGRTLLGKTVSITSKLAETKTNEERVRFPVTESVSDLNLSQKTQKSSTCTENSENKLISVQTEGLDKITSKNELEVAAKSPSQSLNDVKDVSPVNTVSITSKSAETKKNKGRLRFSVKKSELNLSHETQISSTCTKTSENNLISIQSEGLNEIILQNNLEMAANSQSQSLSDIKDSSSGNPVSITKKLAGTKKNKGRLRYSTKKSDLNLSHKTQKSSTCTENSENKQKSVKSEGLSKIILKNDSEMGTKLQSQSLNDVKDSSSANTISITKKLAEMKKNKGRLRISVKEAASDLNLSQTTLISCAHDEKLENMLQSVETDISPDKIMLQNYVETASKPPSQSSNNIKNGKILFEESHVKTKINEKEHNGIDIRKIKRSAKTKALKTITEWSEMDRLEEAGCIKQKNETVDTVNNEILGTDIKENVNATKSDKQSNNTSDKSIECIPTIVIKDDSEEIQIRDITPVKLLDTSQSIILQIMYKNMKYKATLKSKDMDTDLKSFTQTPQFRSLLSNISGINREKTFLFKVIANEDEKKSESTRLKMHSDDVSRDIPNTDGASKTFAKNKCSKEKEISHNIIKENQDIEVIDLLSDEEDSDQLNPVIIAGTKVSKLEIESRLFYVPPMTNDVWKSHQIVFRKKCVVKLEKTKIDVLARKHKLNLISSTQKKKFKPSDNVSDDDVVVVEWDSSKKSAKKRIQASAPVIKDKKSLILDLNSKRLKKGSFKMPCEPIRTTTRSQKNTYEPINLDLTSSDDDSANDILLNKAEHDVNTTVIVFRDTEIEHPSVKTSNYTMLDPHAKHDSISTEVEINLGEKKSNLDLPMIVNPNEICLLDSQKVNNCSNEDNYFECCNISEQCKISCNKNEYNEHTDAIVDDDEKTQKKVITPLDLNETLTSNVNPASDKGLFIMNRECNIEDCDKVIKQNSLSEYSILTASQDNVHQKFINECSNVVEIENPVENCKDCQDFGRNENSAQMATMELDDVHSIVEIDHSRHQEDHQNSTLITKEPSVKTLRELCLFRAVGCISILHQLHSVETNSFNEISPSECKYSNNHSENPSVVCEQQIIPENSSSEITVPEFPRALPVQYPKVSERNREILENERSYNKEINTAEDVVMGSIIKVSKDITTYVTENLDLRNTRKIKAISVADTLKTISEDVCFDQELKKDYAACTNFCHETILAAVSDCKVYSNQLISNSLLQSHATQKEIQIDNSPEGQITKLSSAFSEEVESNMSTSKFIRNHTCDIVETKLSMDTEIPTEKLYIAQESISKDHNSCAEMIKQTNDVKELNTYLDESEIAEKTDNDLKKSDAEVNDDTYQLSLKSVQNIYNADTKAGEESYSVSVKETRAQQNVCPEVNQNCVNDNLSQNFEILEDSANLNLLKNDICYEDRQVAIDYVKRNDPDAQEPNESCLNVSEKIKIEPKTSLDITEKNCGIIFETKQEYNSAVEETESYSTLLRTELNDNFQRSDNIAENSNVSETEHESHCIASKEVIIDQEVCPNVDQHGYGMHQIKNFKAEGRIIDSLTRSERNNDDFQLIMEHSQDKNSLDADAVSLHLTVKEIKVKPNFCQEIKDNMVIEHDTGIDNLEVFEGTDSMKLSISEVSYEECSIPGESVSASDSKIPKESYLSECDHGGIESKIDSEITQNNSYFHHKTKQTNDSVVQRIENDPPSRFVSTENLQLSMDATQNSIVPNEVCERYCTESKEVDVQQINFREAIADSDDKVGSDTVFQDDTHKTNDTDSLNVSNCNVEVGVRTEDPSNPTKSQSVGEENDINISRPEIIDNNWETVGVTRDCNRSHQSIEEGVCTFTVDSKNNFETKVFDTYDLPLIQSSNIKCNPETKVITEETFLVSKDENGQENPQSITRKKVRKEDLKKYENNTYVEGTFATEERLDKTIEENNYFTEQDIFGIEHEHIGDNSDFLGEICKGKGQSNHQIIVRECPITIEVEYGDTDTETELIEQNCHQACLSTNKNNNFMLNSVEQECTPLIELDDQMIVDETCSTPDLITDDEDAPIKENNSLKINRDVILSEEHFDDLAPAIPNDQNNLNITYDGVMSSQQGKNNHRDENNISSSSESFSDYKDLREHMEIIKCVPRENINEINVYSPQKEQKENLESTPNSGNVSCVNLLGAEISAPVLSQSLSLGNCKYARNERQENEPDINLKQVSVSVGSKEMQSIRKSVPEENYRINKKDSTNSIASIIPTTKDSENFDVMRDITKNSAEKIMLATDVTIETSELTSGMDCVNNECTLESLKNTIPVMLEKSEESLVSKVFSVDEEKKQTKEEKVQDNIQDMSCSGTIRANADEFDRFCATFFELHGSSSKKSRVYSPDNEYITEIDASSVGREVISPSVADQSSFTEDRKLIESMYYDVEESIDPKDLHNVDASYFIIPKKNYGRQLAGTKRKIGMHDVNLKKKKYRKGKCIDHPKLTKSGMEAFSYKEQIKKIEDYKTSFKLTDKQVFLRSEPEDMNVETLGPYIGVHFDETLYKEDLEPDGAHMFEDFDEKDLVQQYTNFENWPDCLNSDITEEDFDKDARHSSDIINTDMGFGEGSDRVIVHLKKDNISKVSAATLSDVKHQPLLQSENTENNKNTNNILFSSNTKKAFSFDSLQNSVSFYFKNYCKYEHNVIVNTCELFRNIPGLYSTDFLVPRFKEHVVNVVQIGQLPVSAPAQNPVSCDPRVSQATDRSPSHFSVDNSPQSGGSDNSRHNEYIELTTANINIPVVSCSDETKVCYDQTDKAKTAPAYLELQNVDPETYVKQDSKYTPMEITNVIAEDHLEKAPEQPQLQEMPNTQLKHMEPQYNTSTTGVITSETPIQFVFTTSQPNSNTDFSTHKENGSVEKSDQLANAMTAAGIATSVPRTQALVNILSQKIICGPTMNNTHLVNNTYQKASINTMAIQQALAQILPPPLNQTNQSENTPPTSCVGTQVLHIVQGKNSSGNQITLVENNQPSVISSQGGTQVLHIVQNKSTSGITANGSHTPTSTFGGISLVDTGLQQSGNQLLHIVNASPNQNKTNNTATAQLLKRVNLLTSLANVQNSNEQKMVQFVCKSVDGKSIQLNNPHQRGMVLRLQPIETPPPNVTITKSEPLSPVPNVTITSGQTKDTTIQQEIKSRSVYEENYAKFIQGAGDKPLLTDQTTNSTKSLPKFNQAFGKTVYQESSLPKQDEMNQNNSPININNNCDHTDLTEETPANTTNSTPSTISLDNIGQITNPQMIIRKASTQSTQPQQNLVQQIKQTITPMNIQTMHGGVIYTRQIPVNIGGGQTINLITVPSTELIEENSQKASQEVSDQPVIKIIPQNQVHSENGSEETDQNFVSGATTPQSQTQPVLTQMRIKLPMLSKTSQVVPGARVMRPFLQIQRNVIAGTNQPVYQQLVLTTAPALGQQTIRLPTPQHIRQVKVPAQENLSTSTLEQLREFDMVLEQVKERSTVQPSPSSTPGPFSNLQNQPEGQEMMVTVATVPSEPQQVLYSIGSNQALNLTYVNRKTITTPTTYIRSPDSSGIADSPTSTQMCHSMSDSSTDGQAKPKVVSKNSRSRPHKPSTSPSTVKVTPVAAKTSVQKPLEDEQTTQRILYILAEYKEQVENSPDKDKPAPRRRSNPPTNPTGSSKRKKSSSSSSRRPGRDSSPVGSVDDPSRTMGSEDSSCGTSQGDCSENCGLESQSPQESPRKVPRKLTFEDTAPTSTQNRLQHRNIIVADGQTIAMARSTGGKPATAVLMPANYLLPVSMVKGGQQIAIVTNRGPKILTMPQGEAGSTNALLLQRLISPAGLKPMLARPGVRHVRLPTAALHNLQAFNIAAAIPAQSVNVENQQAGVPADTNEATDSSSWRDESAEAKAEESCSGSEAGEGNWRLQNAAENAEYNYEDPQPATPQDCTTERTVLVVHKKEIIGATQHGGSALRHATISAAALRHKYAVLEHELRLQKSLSEECADLGVDSPSAAELFPEAELLFAASPHEHDHHPPPVASHATVGESELEEDSPEHIQQCEEPHKEALDTGLSLGGIVTVAGAVTLDHEEFARAHPNTTFHSEPTDDEVQPFTIAALKGRHITSAIFHPQSNGNGGATVLMTAPAHTVISHVAQEESATPGQTHVKYAVNDMTHMIEAIPPTSNPSVLVKDDGLTRFENVLTDSREIHLSNSAPAIVHTSETQVIRRVGYEHMDKDPRDSAFSMDETDAIAGEDAKMSVVEDSSRDATLESIAGDADDDRSSPERHAELFWESNSASERSESRRPIDFSSDSEKCCKSPSLDETNSTDSSLGRVRLDSVIKEARRREQRCGSGASSTEESQPPVRTYPAKRAAQAAVHTVQELGSTSGKTRVGSPQESATRRRASSRGVVKRGCHCCNGSPETARPKKFRKKSEFTPNE